MERKQQKLVYTKLTLSKITACMWQLRSTFCKTLSCRCLCCNTAALLVLPNNELNAHCKADSKYQYALKAIYIRIFTATTQLTSIAVHQMQWKVVASVFFLAAKFLLLPRLLECPRHGRTHALCKHMNCQSFASVVPCPEEPRLPVLPCPRACTELACR